MKLKKKTDNKFALYIPYWGEWGGRGGTKFAFAPLSWINKSSHINGFSGKFECSHSPAGSQYFVTVIWPQKRWRFLDECSKKKKEKSPYKFWNFTAKTDKWQATFVKFSPLNERLLFFKTAAEIYTKHYFIHETAMHSGKKNREHLLIFSLVT